MPWLDAAAGAAQLSISSRWVDQGVAGHACGGHTAGRITIVCTCFYTAWLFSCTGCTLHHAFCALHRCRSLTCNRRLASQMSWQLTRCVSRYHNCKLLRAKQRRYCLIAAGASSRCNCQAGSLSFRRHCRPGGCDRRCACQSGRAAARVAGEGETCEN